MKVTLFRAQNSSLSTTDVGKRITGATLSILLAVTAMATRADVASRVLESNSASHKGVLAHVHDASEQGRKSEPIFFGQGLRKVGSMAPDFQIRIVEPEDIPGDVAPGSLVVLTPEGDQVVNIQSECKTVTKLRALVVGSTNAPGVAAQKVAAYFEYDH